jgi:hypothetical protein
MSRNIRSQHGHKAQRITMYPVSRTVMSSGNFHIKPISWHPYQDTVSVSKPPWPFAHVRTQPEIGDVGDLSTHKRYHPKFAPKGT